MDNIKVELGQAYFEWCMKPSKPAEKAERWALMQKLEDALTQAREAMAAPPSEARAFAGVISHIDQAIDMLNRIRAFHKGAPWSE